MAFELWMSRKQPSPHAGHLKPGCIIFGGLRIVRGTGIHHFGPIDCQFSCFTAVAGDPWIVTRWLESGKVFVAEAMGSSTSIIG